MTNNTHRSHTQIYTDKKKELFCTYLEFCVKNKDPHGRGANEDLAVRADTSGC